MPDISSKIGNSLSSTTSSIEQKAQENILQGRSVNQIISKQVALIDEAIESNDKKGNIMQVAALVILAAVVAFVIVACIVFPPVTAALIGVGAFFFMSGICLPTFLWGETYKGKANSLKIVKEKLNTDENFRNHVQSSSKEFNAQNLITMYSEFRTSEALKNDPHIFSRRMAVSSKEQAKLMADPELMSVTSKYINYCDNYKKILLLAEKLDPEQKAQLQLQLEQLDKIKEYLTECEDQFDAYEFRLYLGCGKIELPDEDELRKSFFQAEKLIDQIYAAVKFEQVL